MTRDTEEQFLPSPFHAGERSLQSRYGVAERMEEIGGRLIRSAMPDQHRVFFAQLPFLVLGSVDGEGRPWATLLEGPPGFVRSPDPRRLEIDRSLSAVDPAREGVEAGAAVGVLGIELPTRRRNRMNGRVRDRRVDGFAIEVEQSFGNCPQYIQRREPRFVEASSDDAPTRVERLEHLDAEARSLIESADTLFVATYVDPDGDPTKRGVDVSHRGGRPGFVRVEGRRLTIPDFAGNLHFNTFGNLVENPRAGLAFVDFTTGDVLQVTGRTEVLFEAPELASYEGAERLWSLDVEVAFRRRGALGLRSSEAEMSRQTLATGSWGAPKTRSPDLA